jgi:signal transduction histidine kinase/CheY-like chemotaxis protein/HPt (histidine-containing phosphotransfer) domain-containing protein
VGTEETIAAGPENSPEYFRAELDKQVKENRKLARQLRSLQELMDRAQASVHVSSGMEAAVQAEKDKRDKYFKMILENSPDIILMFDAFKRFAYCTNAFLKLMNIASFDAINGRTFAEVMSPVIGIDPAEEMVAIFQQAVVENRSISVDQVLDLQGSGSPRYYTIHFTPMVDRTGAAEGAMMLFHDMTDIYNAMEDAKQASKAKSAFLANTSHEIRTPMNAILGMAELILREELSQTIFGYTMNIKQAGNNLMAIINDVLDFSKIESGKLDIVSASYLLSSMLNDVISVIRMKVMEKPIELLIYMDGNMPNNLYGDVIRIRQVLMNLLSNAVKYTQRGFITLRIGGTRLNEESFELSISIIDTGIGIKEEDYPKLFGDFVQVDTTRNRGIEGTGLGLAISRNLCNLMGGDITFSSVYGTGSTFTMTIVQKITGKEVLARVEEPKTKPVLLYEIHEEIAQTLCYAFDNLGVPCTWVKMQSKFYEALLEDHYAYIFTGYPTLEGVLQVVEKMKLIVKVVVMAEYGTQVRGANVAILPQPVHAMSIADMLNNVSEYVGHEENPDAIRFMAPRARVLIVDDINTNLIVARGLMLPFRMQMDVCQSGQLAITMVQKNRYDIVFMDHMMPEMDGIEATARIRALESPDGYYRDLPIIALTANAVSGMKDMFIQHGMNDFLAKPIEIGKLNTILDKWLPDKKKEAYVENLLSESSIEVFADLEEVSEEPFSIDGIDVKTGLSMTGGTMDFYLESLRSYVKDGREKVVQIGEVLRNGDSALYTTYVHALKSASASIGAIDVSESAKKLEMAGKNQDMDYINAKNDGFVADLESILANIAAFLKVRDGKSAAVLDEGSPEDLRNDLAALREALDAMDIQKSDQLIKQIASRKWDAGLAGRIQDLSQYVLFSDFDEAIELIDNLLKQ